MKVVMKIIWLTFLSLFLILILNSSLKEDCVERSSETVTETLVKDSGTLKAESVIKSLMENGLVIQEIELLDEGVRNNVLCLALNIYHEARGSTIQDRIATSYVVFNRLEDVSYPLLKSSEKTVCGIVFDPYQFCWTSGSIKLPSETDAWIDAQSLALTLYMNEEHKRLAKRFGLKHYVAKGLVLQKSCPKWVQKRTFLVTIGGHSYISLDKTINNTVEEALEAIENGYRIVGETGSGK